MENFDNDEKAKIEIREHQRYSIPAMVTCTFLEESLRGKSSFQGFIQDISFGGVSLEVRDDFLIISDSLLKYTDLEMAVELDLPDGKHRLNFSGVIRWQKRVKKNNMSFLYLGIQFYDLKESDRNVLKKYLSLGTGDKNLIWNLWDNILMQP
ncbi:MAG: hypothetical protein GQ554_03480 [Deltaproteobacteria bacterium]|nr:hypothetical protein [Deltaproteobacteria bacterium]